MATLSKATLDAIAAAVTAAIAASAPVVSAPVAPSAAASHFKARDLPCLATPRCDKLFRTAKGQAFHTANVKAK